MLDGGAFGRGWRGSNEGARGSEGWAGEQGAPCFRVAASGLIDAWKYCESVFCTRHALSTVSTLGGCRQGAVRVDVVMAEAAPAAKESVAMATVAVVRWIAGSGGEVEKEGGGGKGCGGDGDGGEVVVLGVAAHLSPNP